MADERIIVAEDESIVALDIKMHLQDYGYNVVGLYSTGEAVLAAIPAAEPDLVLLDIRLQGDLDGLETAEVIKARHDIPVILMTAYSDDVTLHRAKVLQPFGYIIKPLEERELRTAIVIALYRHSMERLLKKRERLFSTTLESILDGVVVADAGGRIEFANPVAEQMLGISRDELVGGQSGDLIHITNAAGDVVSLPGRADGVLYLRDGNGQKIPVEVATAPLGDPEERSGLVWVLHDVTERVKNEQVLKERESQLRQSQKMEAIGRLTGGIAHDFNNLLTVIMGYSTLLAEELAEGQAVDREAVRSDVEGIQKAARRSSSLTRQLLAFSRSQMLEPRPVSINQTVSDLEKMLNRLIGEDLQLHVDLAAEPDTVYVDPSQIEQVVMNLAVNGRDAMKSGGALNIRTQNCQVDSASLAGRESVEPGRFVVLSVADSGTGMDRETLEQIFDPFFTTKEMGRGTGLGLSTVYGIVTQSHGFIDVQSVVNEGSTFKVYLPLHTGSAGAPDGEDRSLENRDGEESLLVVEDDEAIRSLLSRLLRRKGYTVIETANAGEALLVCEDLGVRIDMVITDIVMPHLAGNALVDRLREQRPDLRFLYVSGFPEGYVSDEQRRTMGIHFMQKPLDPLGFTRRVRLILDS